MDSNTQCFHSMSSQFLHGGILIGVGKRSQIPWIATNSPFIPCLVSSFMEESLSVKEGGLRYLGQQTFLSFHVQLAPSWRNPQLPLGTMLLIGEGKEVSDTLDSNTHWFHPMSSQLLHGVILCSPVGQCFLSVEGKRSQIPKIATNNAFIPCLVSSFMEEFFATPKKRRCSLLVQGKGSEKPWIATHSPFPPCLVSSFMEQSFAPLKKWDDAPYW